MSNMMIRTSYKHYIKKKSIQSTLLLLYLVHHPVIYNQPSLLAALGCSPETPITKSTEEEPFYASDNTETLFDTIHDWLWLILLNSQTPS